MRIGVSALLSLLVLSLAAHGAQREEDGKGETYSNSWAVEIAGGDEVAELIAKKHGFTNLGQVGSLEGIYHFVHQSSPRRSRRSLDSKHADLTAESQVNYVEQQVVKTRVKRSYTYEPPTDTSWNKQWYLNRGSGHHMNVELAWELDIIGRGAVVSILDDGIEYTHPDLKDSYDELASYDFNSHDPDPIPRYDISNENKHGTRCAGEVSANNGGHCGVGAAYGAKVGGVRMLDGDVTDVVESSSLSLNPQHIDIYSSSWGPNDDGKTVDGPGKLAQRAFLDGVTKGRGGLGSIFVWAAGNGGRMQDSCNCDGYAVSPYTISVGSASEKDEMPWYAEVCSSTLAATYSSGGGSEKQIVTVDLHKKCTMHHTGTSASAPLAAGIFALALEANHNLTWRDMQYLVVYTSNPSFSKDPNWHQNGAGLSVSHRYGFGVIDAAALVHRAMHWAGVPTQENCAIDVTLAQKEVTVGHPLTVTIPVGDSCSITYLEHVQAVATLTIKEGRRGDVSLKLTSPSHTTSQLLPYRNPDFHQDGFHKWPFMTVHSWGESPGGDWKFVVETRIHNQYSQVKHTKVSLDELQLVLHGTKSSAVSVQGIPATCHSECAGKCSGPGAANCDTCKTARVTSTHECVDRCPKGTYQNVHMCRECPKLCAECHDSELCIRCSDDAVRLESGQCAESCPELYFLISDERTCRPCHHSCLECNGLSEANCTACPGQFSLEGGRCILNHACSKDEYFDDRALECRRCHKSCAQCVGKEDHHCTACYPGFVVSEGLCVVDTSVSEGCSPGHYLNDITSKCAPCPDGCADCSDEITCTSCEDSHYLETHRVGESSEETRLCVKECSQGFYGDPDTGSCAPCPSYCSACVSPVECTSCSLKNFTAPVDGQCPQPCHESQYYDFDDKQCQPCDTGCHLCMNKDSCHHCSPGFFLTKTADCVHKCPEGTVPEEGTRTCQEAACHSSCLTCYGPGPDECMSCVNGVILHENSCVDNCPAHYFFNGTSCQPCHNSCLTCAGSDDANCLSCPGGYILDHYHCATACPPRSFNFSGECLACPKSCQSCGALGKCDVCDPGFQLLPGGECVDCPKYCRSCSSSDRCDVCNDGFLLLTDSGACVEKCPQGHFRQEDTCEACLPKCDVCDSASSCQSCRNGFSYYQPQRSCMSPCPNGYYNDGKTCIDCKFPCSSCSSPTKCLDCQNGYVMDKATGNCERCCNADRRSNDPCCDCDSDDTKCLWADHTRSSTASKPQNKDDSGPIRSVSSLAITLAVVGAIMVAVILSLAVYVGVRVHRARRARHYSPVASDPLTVMDNDSGSEFEAELFAKT